MLIFLILMSISERECFNGSAASHTLRGLVLCCSFLSKASSKADPFRLPEDSRGGGTSSTFSSVDSFTSQNPNSFTFPAFQRTLNIKRSILLLLTSCISWNIARCSHQTRNSTAWQANARQLHTHCFNCSTVNDLKHSNYHRFQEAPWSSKYIQITDYQKSRESEIPMRRAMCVPA